MEYTFGVSGRLLRNALVMYDHQTNSEWSQIRGEALTGPMAGTKLRHLAANQMTWREWRGRFPHTLALEKPALSIDSYQGYYESSAYRCLDMDLEGPSTLSKRKGDRRGCCRCRNCVCILHLARNAGRERLVQRQTVAGRIRQVHGKRGRI